LRRAGFLCQIVKLPGAKRFFFFRPYSNFSTKQLSIFPTSYSFPADKPKLLCSLPVSSAQEQQCRLHQYRRFQIKTGPAGSENRVQPQLPAPIGLSDPVPQALQQAGPPSGPRAPVHRNQSIVFTRVEWRFPEPVNNIRQQNPIYLFFPRSLIEKRQARVLGFHGKLGLPWCSAVYSRLQNSCRINHAESKKNRAQSRIQRAAGHRRYATEESSAEDIRCESG